ncbi:MAG: Asp-tRNA(Asn)/Glu-tRNA(Gln) amidotransferase subunit GatB [Thermoanaerobaculia bacterium]
MAAWKAVIGLEVHARLLTRTKLFCRCATHFGAPPNSQLCEVCLGYPGALPVVNRKAVELAVRMAHAVGAQIDPSSRFARKNYFYPDLPKGYQITQHDRPLATGGSVAGVVLRRIHMEEDAGKLIHTGAESLVDLNRAGVPLIEIVTEAVIASSEQAVAYLTRLRQILMYSDVCDGNMDEGSLRCDANVSVRRAGEPLGTRTEVKNLNSFRFLGRAVEFEIARQIAVLERGGRVTQETRLFDVASNETRVMRSKEESHDYRYFPEPDLPPLVLDEGWIDEIARSVPPLPDERIRRYTEELHLTNADAEVLVTSRALADYFEETAAAASNPHAAANWVRNEVLRLVNEQKTDIAGFRVKPTDLARLIAMIDSGEIGGKVAKEVFEELAERGGDPREIVASRGLAQLSDPDQLRDIARRVIESHPQQVARYRGGQAKLFGFLVGQLMKETRGKANAELANTILREMLDS